MNILFGGANNETESVTSIAFGFLIPLGLAIICFVYAARSVQKNSQNNENIKKLQIILFTQGAIYTLIFGLYSLSGFIPSDAASLILVQKLLILSLIAISGYGISVYDQTDQSAKEIRNVVFGISLVGLLTGLPLIKSVPQCILDNIKTELI
jgi:TRAP-type C4-dicarboxylate transport system permease large subunit